MLLLLCLLQYKEEPKPDATYGKGSEQKPGDDGTGTQYKKEHLKKKKKDDYSSNDYSSNDIVDNKDDKQDGSYGSKDSATDDKVSSGWHARCAVNFCNSINCGKQCLTAEHTPL